MALDNSLRKVIPMRRPKPEAKLGPVGDANQVADEIFGGCVSSRWVKDNIHVGRVRLLKRKVLYDMDVVRRYVKENVNVA